VLRDRYRRFGRDAESFIRDHWIELPASVPPIVIAHGTDPALNVRAAIKRMDGMGRFVGPDDVVVVKPQQVPGPCLGCFLEDLQCISQPTPEAGCCWA